MVTKPEAFIPGTVWTRALQQQCIDRMLAVIESPEMQQAMNDAAEPPDPNAAANDFTRPDASPKQRSDARVDRAKCVIRRARPHDVPRMAQMMLESNLPPLFIDEWLPGFAVVEHEGDVIGCGGGEIYDDACVIRSVVVEPRAGRLGLGRTVAGLLIADARAAGVTDAYLFTVDAHPFWLRQGFVDVPLDAWKPSPRRSWQYWFISGHPDAVEGVHSMWKRTDG